MNEEDYLIYLDFVRRYEKRTPLNQTESGKKLLIEIKQKLKDHENKRILQRWNVDKIRY